VDSSGKVVESQKLAAFPALPRRQQRYVLALKTGLPPDQYTLGRELKWVVKSSRVRWS